MNQHRADGLTGDPLLDGQQNFTADGTNGGNGGPPLGGQQFLSYADLEVRYGKNRVTLWRWVKTGRLPAPYSLGPNSTAFSLREILASEAKLKRKSYGPEAAV